MSKLLDNIKEPNDLKKLDLKQLNMLADEIREFLITSVSKTGGHLASNLGVVELTIALHWVFSSPEDRIIWDVGHQSYVHKILTGRKEQFATLRQYGGLSGFPKSHESQHDVFNTGHSSTSISAALGIARARDLKNENYSVIAVIGDGALTGGMAFEALNDAGRSSNNLIVILNDNEMSINKNVGGLSKYLTRIRTEPVYFKVKEDIDLFLNRIPAIGKSMARTVQKAKGSIKYMIMPGTLFEELGFTYIGPIDGHNIEQLTGVLNRAKKMKGPILIHVYTVKGKGYSFAEEEPDIFHGVSSFNVETGKALDKTGIKDYSGVFGDCINELAEKDESIVAITAAMPVGTGLNKMLLNYPNRVFDVGIAEQHAVTLAAALAISGLKPVVAIYSSFLQRAYDQILHDVAMQNLHVVFAIDRAGVVGQDGETHQGIFDLSYLGHIPNLAILAPSCYSELRQMLNYAVLRHNGPIAVRYPKGSETFTLPEGTPEFELGKGVILKEGKDITLVAAGKMVPIAMEAAEKVRNLNIDAEVIDVRSIKPLDINLIISSGMKTGRIITLEDNILAGGMGNSILRLLNEKKANHIKVYLKGFPDEFIPQGSVSELFKVYGLDSDSIVKDIIKTVND